MIEVIHIREMDGTTPDVWPEGYVYIGRPGRGFSGEFGNPYNLTQGTREVVIDKFRKWIVVHPEVLEALKAKNPTHLVCFCAPKACHGDVYAELLNTDSRVDNNGHWLGLQ